MPQQPTLEAHMGLNGKPAAPLGNKNSGDSDQFSTMSDHIILCSLRNLGYRILEQLLDAKIPVVIVDDKPDPRFARLAQRRNVPLLHDDSRLPEILKLAGIERARAIIAVNENDLHNLETVLAANEVCKGVRAVASFFNNQIGQQLIKAVPNAQALDLSRIAPPTFVSATIASSVLHRFTIQGQELVVVEATPHEAGTVGRLYHRTTALLLSGPLPLESPSGEDISANTNSQTQTGANQEEKFKSIVCPLPDCPIESGDRVGLIGTLEELQNLVGVDLWQPALKTTATTTKSRFWSAPKKRRNFIWSTRRFLSGVVGGIERPFRLTLLALLLIVIFSTIFFTVGYRDLADNGSNLNPLEALYFTVTIITTIGFGDMSLHHQEWWVLVYGIILELIGASSLAILYAFLTNFIVSRRIEQSLGMQRATDMENHVIVTSLGSGGGFGYRVVEGLVKSGQDVIVMEKDDHNSFVPLVQALGVTVIFGDSRLEESLRRVNISKASCVAVVSNDDMINLETALTARSLRHDIRLVLRIFDGSLADKVERTFGIEIASSTSALSAPSFIAAALNYEVISSFFIKRQVFIVVRLVVSEVGQIKTKTVEWLYQQAGVRILTYIAASTKTSLDDSNAEAAAQPAPIFHPNLRVRLYSGDTIYFVGPTDRILHLHQLNTPEAQIEVEDLG